MSVTPVEPTAQMATAPACDGYEHLADVFSRVYEATNDIAITLEVLDANRAREDVAKPIPDLPTRVLAVAASLFHVTSPGRLLRPGRHRDLCAARWVSAWVLHRRGWSTLKIGRFLRLDHSTVLHGLRRVAGSRELLLCARDAETRVESQGRSAG